jgi:hypothetical protein
MRQRKKKVYSSSYDTDDKIIDWLHFIFKSCAECDYSYNGGGKVSKADIMNEAAQYGIDPEAVERVAAKHSQIFATTGPELWYPVKKIRIRIEQEPEPAPEAKRSKRSSEGFFPDVLPDRLSATQEKRVLASARKQMRAALVE